MQAYEPLSFDGHTIEKDGRVGSSSSYAIIAASRLCGGHLNQLRGCALTLLCTKCGVCPTLHMSHVSRESDTLRMQRLEDGTSALQCKTVDGRSRFLVPPVIVLDAVSVIRVSQREAVVVGAGLSAPVRPLQGPICATCSCSIALESNRVDDRSLDTMEEDISRPLLETSRKYTFCTTSSARDFTDGCKKIINAMKNMKLCKISSTSATGSSGMTVQTSCDCRNSVLSSPCTNRRVSNLQTLAAFTTQQDSFTYVVGHVMSPQAEQVAGVQVSEMRSHSTAYEICIVDTRVQHMCSLSQQNNSSSVFVNDGIAGQFHYMNALSSCSRGLMSCGFDEGGFCADASTSVDTMPIPGLQASCLVCSTLLDMSDQGLRDQQPNVFGGGNFRFRQSNAVGRNNTSVYLMAHHNWAHYDCTVACEKMYHGCMGRCPRLNTFVSTTFDGSPRFEDICPSCLHHDVSTTSRVATRNSSLHPVHNGSDKPPLQASSSGDWLSSASSMRKQAALNVAKTGANISKHTKPTPKEMRDRAAAASFLVDKSGVFYVKEHASWHSLDAKGENPKPVSGMAFWDPVFQEIRIWDSTQQRDIAVANHESLAYIRDM